MIFPTQELDDTTLTARIEYPIGLYSYIFVNGVKIYKIKAKDTLLVPCDLFNLYIITSLMFGSEAAWKIQQRGFLDCTKLLYKSIS